MTYLEIPIESPIEEKITWAEICYRKMRDLLLADERLVGLLLELRKAIHISHDSMAEAGVINECKACEQKDGGSCCGRGLEKKYSGILLLINLLL